MVDFAGSIGWEAGIRTPIPWSRASRKTRNRFDRRGTLEKFVTSCDGVPSQRNRSASFRWQRYTAGYTADRTILSRRRHDLVPNPDAALIEAIQHSSASIDVNHDGLVVLRVTGVSLTARCQRAGHRCRCASIRSVCSGLSRHGFGSLRPALPRSRAACLIVSHSPGPRPVLPTRAACARLSGPFVGHSPP